MKAQSRRHNRIRTPLSHSGAPRCRWARCHWPRAHRQLTTLTILGASRPNQASRPPVSRTGPSLSARFHNPQSTIASPIRPSSRSRSCPSLPIPPFPCFAGWDKQRSTNKPFSVLPSRPSCVTRSWLAHPPSVRPRLWQTTTTRDTTKSSSELGLPRQHIHPWAHHAPRAHHPVWIQAPRRDS